MPRHKQSPEQISTMQNRILDATVSLLDELQPEEISIRTAVKHAGIKHADSWENLVMDHHIRRSGQ